MWYAGLLREISPIDEATWDYEIDLEAITKEHRYSLPVSIGSDLFHEMVSRVEALPIEKVQEEADEGDMWMQIELAIRCGEYSLCFTYSY